jgi:glutamate synthase (NADPH/NADH) large chain/glutamate synthase (ferredoxin)
MKASIICETGEARDVHQFACLIGYGASAICPYLGFGTVRELIEQIKVTAPAGCRARRLGRSETPQGAGLS